MTGSEWERERLLPVVELVWVDASGRAGWVGSSPHCPVVECTSVGLLLRRSREGITICQSISSDSDYSDVLTIPRACLRRVRQIGKVRRGVL